MRNIDNARASKAYIRQHKRLNTHMPMQMRCTHKSHKQQHSVQHNALQQASRMKKSPMGMFTDFATRYCTGGRGEPSARIKQVKSCAHPSPRLCATCIWVPLTTWAQSNRPVNRGDGCYNSTSMGWTINRLT